MNPYWLLGGKTHALGGFNDLISIHLSLQNAVNAALNLVQSKRIKWWHIAEVSSGIIVMQSETKPYGANKCC